MTTRRNCSLTAASLIHWYGVMERTRRARSASSERWNGEGMTAPGCAGWSGEQEEAPGPPSGHPRAASFLFLPELRRTPGTVTHGYDPRVPQRPRGRAPPWPPLGPLTSPHRPAARAHTHT